MSSTLGCYARRARTLRRIRPLGRLQSTSTAAHLDTAGVNSFQPPLADLAKLSPQNCRWLSGVNAEATNISEPLNVFEGTELDLETLKRIADKTPTPLRLQSMYKYGRGIDKEQRIKNAGFLHTELPTRIAQRAYDLLTLPYGLSDSEPIRQVAKTYVRYLQYFRELPRPITPELEDQFTDQLQSLVLDRTEVPISIFQGIQAWLQEHEEAKKCHLREMEEALYRFFTARVGLRFLVEHHVLSSQRESSESLRKATFMFSADSELLGCIQTNLDPVKECQRVADLVRLQTEEMYGLCPDIEVVNSVVDQHNSADFTYAPHHLHYMVSELVKNSCRASVHRFQHALKNENPKAKLGKVQVVIVRGAEDVTIKVADKGGGIPRSKMERIWKFAHSTADESESAAAFGRESATGAPIRGFGLPLARIYSRYFGGELTLKSMEGYGLDAYLHLPRLGDACENLPRRVQSSPGQGVSIPIPGIRQYSSKRQQV